MSESSEENKKFDLKSTPIYIAIIAMVALILRLIPSDKDEEVLEEIKEAIEKSLTYEGDIVDIIQAFFDAIEWAVDQNPNLAGKAWIDIVFGLLESLLIAALGNRKAKIHPLMTIIKAKIKANQAIRRDRRKAKRQK